MSEEMSEETTTQDKEGGAPTAEQVTEALKVVVDPELGINIVDLGLVYDVAVEDEVVKITYTLTTMGCPVGPLIEQQMQQVLTTLPGISNVESEMVFTPPWSPELMSEEARLAMGMF
jgi:metal-sulfur cluster biosynthetic enzyme